MSTGNCQYFIQSIMFPIQDNRSWSLESVNLYGKGFADMIKVLEERLSWIMRVGLKCNFPWLTPHEFFIYFRFSYFVSRELCRNPSFPPWGASLSSFFLFFFSFLFLYGILMHKRSAFNIIDPFHFLICVMVNFIYWFFSLEFKKLYFIVRAQNTGIKKTHSDQFYIYLQVASIIMYQSDWVTEWSDIWLNVILGVPVRMFLDAINIWICKLSKVDCPPQCEKASFNPLKAWMEQKRAVRENLLSAWLPAGT